MKHKLYTRLLSLALAVGLVIGMLPSAAAVDTVGGSAGQAALNVSADNGLEMQKTVKPVAGTDDQFKITLEAWTTGEVTQGQPTPSDIVLVVDMSTSMESQFSSSAQYTPVYQLNTSSTYYVKNGYSYKAVEWCDNCRAWTDGCSYSWWSGHDAGTPYTPKTSENDTATGHVQFYSRVSTRLEALQQAANAFIAQVAEQSTDDRIAIVGFGRYAYYLTGSSANNAFYDATTYEQNLQSVISSIGTNSHSLESATEHGKGLANTVEIFKANNNPNRNKIVVVITDGEPAPQSTDNWSSRVVKQAINNAYDLKNTYDAKIYSISVMPGTNAANPTQPMDKYMSYVSSNYPNAKYTGLGLDDRNNSGNTYYSKGNTANGQNTILNQVTPGSKVQDGNYYLTASNIEELEEIFGDIGDQIETPKIDLDETAVLQDEVTKYFVAPDGVSEVTVQTDNYNGTAFENKPTTLSGASVTFDGNKVQVSGFDYSGNFISNTQKLDGTYGKKLIVSFVVQAHPEFWGGNDVPTNVGETSGVYNGEGELVENFVQPDPVDVPLKDISLTGKDVNVYYGGATPDAEDLVNQIDFPTDWRTDYVNAITYSTNNTVSNTQDGSYTVTATLSPKYTGTYSNETATADAAVDVFTPTITWQDSSNAYGTSLTNEFLAGHNVKTEWKHGTIDSSTVTMFGTEPSLNYEFTDETGSALSETLTQETHVKVSAVKIGDTDILANTKFEWQKDSNCPKTCTDPNDEYQFRIHMATSHTNEYPVRFYLEGVGSGAPNYPFIDDWAKLDAVFSGGYVAIPSANTCVYSNDLVVPNGTHQASDTITGNNAVARWLTDNQATPNLTVSDIKTALESLVALGNLSKDTVLETVGNTQYTVEDILASPEDFELRYTQVAENTDVIQEYYKGNRNGMYQQSYHVHLTVVRKPGDLTITKTFEGIDTPPTGFNIQVKDGNTVIETLTLGNADSNQNGTYTWIITDIPEATYTIIENGTDVTDMVLHATFEGADALLLGTTATIDVTGGVDKTVAITNSYSAADGKLNINKVVTEFANNGKPVFDFKLTATDGNRLLLPCRHDRYGSQYRKGCNPRRRCDSPRWRLHH